MPSDYLEDRRQWDNVCKEIKDGKNLSSENSMSSKTVLKNEGETKIFLGKQNVREFLPARLSLKEMLMGVLG